MPKGVTTQDVWSACDALLLEGARPTIERVRQKLGRGSPNTVGPMLDTWFKGLGARLADPQAFASAPTLPEFVLQMAQQLWDHAAAQARGDLDTQLKDGLAQARAQVEEAAAAERTARTQVQEQRDELTRLREQHETQREHAAVTRTQLLQAQRQADDLRQRMEHLQAQLERQRTEGVSAMREVQENAQSNQRRLALDLDAERQHRIKTERRVETLESTLQEQRESAHAAELSHAERMARLQSQHEEREVALGRLHAEHEMLIAQLSVARADAEATQREAHAATQQLALAERLIATLKPSRGPRTRIKVDSGTPPGRSTR